MKWKKPKRKTPEVKASKPKATKRYRANPKKIARASGRPPKPPKASSPPVAGRDRTSIKVANCSRELAVSSLIRPFGPPSPASGRRKYGAAKGRSSWAELERGRSRKLTPIPTLPRRPGEGGNPSDLYHVIAAILRSARANAYRAINFTMVEAYWNVGRTIVEDEQRGEDRAKYGEAILKTLSDRLMAEFGTGFSQQSLRNMRQFYHCFPIRSALRSELSWSHYKALIRVENKAARHYYASEAAGQNWSTRALERQINSLYYERLLISKDKKPVVDEMRRNTALPSATPKDFIKDPYVLEFLGIPDVHPFREADLEQAIIDKLQAFMLELGKGFAFVGRQYRISTETKDFFIDLVFYNYILKCFVLVDLKTAELTHQDIGQMDMYVRLFEDAVKGAGDNPTVGIILCTERDHTVVKYSVLNENRRLFASRYKLYLPTEEALRQELARERALAVREVSVKYSATPQHGMQ